MNSGAAGAASRNARVIDMEELKQARERRASSARHPLESEDGPEEAFREQYEEWREEQDDTPFWERDDPFGADGYAPRRKAGKERRVQRREPESELYEEYAPEEEEEEEEYVPMRGRAKLQYEARAPRQADRRPPRQNGGGHSDNRTGRQQRADGRRQSQYDDGRQGRTQGRRQEREAPAPRSRAGLYMFMLLLGLLALAVVIGFKVFEITDIQVKGSDTMTAQDVIALSGIQRGENIFKVNLGQARKNLESDPLVQVLGISRIFPDKIRIEIHQRKPHGAIAYLGAYVVIDEKGFVLDERPDLPAGQYPLITGIEIQPSEKGKPLVGADGAALDVMDKLLSALYDNKAMQFIGEANLSDGDNIKLLTSEGLEIDLGKPADLPKKAQWIASTVPELRKQGYTSGVLYVTGTGSPVFSGAQESGGGNQENASAEGDASQENGDAADEGADADAQEQADEGGDAGGQGGSNGNAA